jgi:RNA polymerase sigma-70 factor (ECF subfamily)
MLKLHHMRRNRATMSAKMNAQEFQTFYQEKFGLIYRYVYSKVGNREEAEDLTSEIFLKAVRSVDQQRSPQSRRNWLYRIASTTIADHWRTYYREPKASLDELLEAGWEGPAEDEPTAISNMEAHLIQSLLQALPEHYREVLTCRFLLNLSIKATALKMGLTEANVKVFQFRALKRAAHLEQVTTEQQARVL